MANMKARVNNAAQLGRAGIGASDVARFQKISRSLSHLDELSCSQELTHRQETRSDNLEKQATALAKPYGLLSYHQSDPRGWSLYLVTTEQLLGHSIDAAYSRGLGVCSE